MARNMHRYEELTPYEFDQEKARASIIYVAAGPLEYHEECNILGLDTNKGYDWCLAAAEITGGIVFPMLPVAPAGAPPFYSRQKLRDSYDLPRYREHYEESFGSLYPGIFFSREACRALYLELLEVLAIELQFKLCVFIGSHGPAGRMLKEIIAEETSEPNGRVGTFHGMRVLVANSTDYNSDFIEAFNKEHRIPKAHHGGLWETALNYAIKPEYFHPEMLDETKYPQHFGPLKDDEFTEVHGRPSKYEFTLMTPEFAKELRDLTVKRLVADVQKNYAEVTKGE